LSSKYEEICFEQRKDHHLQKIKLKQKFLGFLVFFQKHEKSEINKELIKWDIGQSLV